MNNVESEFPIEDDASLPDAPPADLPPAGEADRRGRELIRSHLPTLGQGPGGLPHAGMRGATFSMSARRGT